MSSDHSDQKYTTSTLTPTELREGDVKPPETQKKKRDGNFSLAVRLIKIAMNKLIHS